MANKHTYVIFDLDGTLIDSRATILDACYRVCADYGVDLPDAESVRLSEIETLFGELSARLGIDRTVFRTAYDRAYSQSPVNGTTINPAVFDALTRAKDNGHYTVLLTNKQRAIVNQVTDSLGLSQYIDIVIARDDAQPIKRADNVIGIFGNLGIDPTLCLTYYGDSQCDSDIADVLGCRYIDVNNINLLN